jgi:hypothetical protein
MIAALAATEHCDLIDIRGRQFARGVTVRWSHCGKYGHIEFSCRDLLEHVPEPVVFFLRFEADRKIQRVISNCCALDLQNRVVDFIVAGPRE